MRAAVNFAEKLTGFSAHWSPRVIAELNEIQFKLVKMQGEFVWHTHEDTDEAFLVLHGQMRIGFRDGEVVVNAGEMFVIPRGVEHITRADDECHALIVEPRGVVNTGDGDAVAECTLTADNDVWA